MFSIVCSDKIRYVPYPVANPAYTSEPKANAAICEEVERPSWLVD